MERRRKGLTGGMGLHGRTGWLTAAVTAGCSVATLSAGPSWALRPDPRPAVEPAPLSAPARPSNSDLEVVRLDPDPAAPGGTTTVHAFVANLGPETTASPFTITVTLPEGVTAQRPFFPTDCKDLGDGHLVRCTFGPGLREGRSATALVPLYLSPGLEPGTLTGGSVSVQSVDDRNERNNRQSFDVSVVETTAG